ncbi:lytic transglycosylase domain-containing protein [Actinacidiphila soli]|uniref:lytic transglycosylase domain-containing protein n=1 Tax=Actinacidiphila soli TaxID=2487275 RepID=UPI000FCA4228|nr:lytic transglycosylase domain-containing protein [Actinacidiphila soli]
MAARYGRRIRRGVAGTAVAAAAMAALTASQGPGFAFASQSSDATRSAVTPPPGPAIDGGSPYYTDLPPLNTASPSPSSTPGTAPGSGTDTSGTGLPATVLDAYQKAQSAIAATKPQCNLRWELLAAIGQVESNQARGGNVDAEGTTLSPILGPVLNGSGFANISDTDHGKWDGDPVHDRAVGPMQFIPSTWATWGADGNGDGDKDPNNIYDAALAAGDYLCADGRDLSVSAELDRAILGYNHSQSYLDTVLSWYDHFRKGGAVSIPDSGSGSTSTPGSTATASSSPTASKSPSASASSSKSASASASATTKKPTASASGTITTSPSASASPSTSPTASSSPSVSPSDSTSASPSPTATGCPTDSASPSASATDTASPSATATDDPCATASASPSASDTPATSESASGKLN